MHSKSISLPRGIIPAEMGGEEYNKLLFKSIVDMKINPTHYILKGSAN
jgi:hypothetical protein